jgi:hypothetical protein
MRFELLATDRGTGARRGRLTTPHGVVETPVFMPCGTQATVKTLDPRDLHEEGCALILCNTYHLYLRPGHEVIQVLGGLHRHARQAGELTVGLPAGLRRHLGLLDTLLELRDLALALVALAELLLDGLELLAQHVLLLALVEVVGGAGPAQPIGAWLLQNGRIQADFGARTKPRGVNEVWVRLAGLSQGRKELAAQGQSGRCGRDDLKTMPPGKAAATLMGSLHKD